MWGDKQKCFVLVGALCGKELGDDRLFAFDPENQEAEKAFFCESMMPWKRIYRIM